MHSSFGQSMNLSDNDDKSNDEVDCKYGPVRIGVIQKVSNGCVTMTNLDGGITIKVENEDI